MTTHLYRPARFLKPSRSKLILLIITLYLLLSGYQLDLPGLHYDEAFEAVPTMQLLYGQPVTTFRQHGLTFMGRTWPLMTQDYIGAINSYASLPFIWLFGPTTLALRLMSIGIGLITLALTYQLTRYLTGSPTLGLVAMTMLAVEPTFIFWNRQGIFVTAVTAPLGLAASCGLLRRTHEGDKRWGYFAAFICGVGLYAKFLFLWLLVAFVIIGLGKILTELQRFIFASPQMSKPKALHSILIESFGLGVAFALGCWPLILYNGQTLGTWLAITNNATHSYYGVNNLAFSDNLMTRLYQYGILLSGGHLWYLGQIINNPLPPFLFSLVTILVLIGTTIRKTTAPLFPFAIIFLVISVSIGTVSALWVTHFAILMPWSAIAITVGGHFIYQQTAGYLSPFTRQAMSRLVGTLFIISQLIATVSYHRALTESGGLSSHSDAIYHLSQWLDEHPNQPVAAMDWGLAAPVTYLTAGRVSPVELFGYAWESDAQLNQRMQQFIQQPNTLYLWRAPDEIIFNRSAEFKALYRPLNQQENIESAFYERSGRPILGVTQLVATGTANNPP